MASSSLWTPGTPKARNSHGDSFDKLVARGQYDSCLSYLLNARDIGSAKGYKVLSILVHLLGSADLHEGTTTSTATEQEQSESNAAVLLKLVKILLNEEQEGEEEDEDDDDDDDEEEEDDDDKDDDESKFSERVDCATQDASSKPPRLTATAVATVGAAKGTAARPRLAARLAAASGAALSEAALPLETLEEMAIGQRTCASDRLNQTRNEMIRCLLQHGRRRRRRRDTQKPLQALVERWYQWDNPNSMTAPVALGVLGGMRYVDRFILERVRSEGKVLLKKGISERRSANHSMEQEQVYCATRTAELMDFYRRAEIVMEGLYYPQSLPQEESCLLHAMCLSMAEWVATGGTLGVGMPIDFFRIVMALHPRAVASQSDFYHSNAPPLSLLLGSEQVTRRHGTVCGGKRLSVDDRERYINVVWELVKYYPDIGCPVDDRGRVPLHYALHGDFFRGVYPHEESKIIRILHHMIQESPACISQADPLTGFFPWMMVASPVERGNDPVPPRAPPKASRGMPRSTLGKKTPNDHPLRQKAGAETRVSFPLLNMAYAMLRNDPNAIPPTAFLGHHSSWYS